MSSIGKSAVSDVPVPAAVIVCPSRTASTSMESSLYVHEKLRRSILPFLARTTPPSPFNSLVIKFGSRDTSWIPGTSTPEPKVVASPLASAVIV